MSIFGHLNNFNTFSSFFNHDLLVHNLASSINAAFNKGLLSFTSLECFKNFNAEIIVNKVKGNLPSSPLTAALLVLGPTPRSPLQNFSWNLSICRLSSLFQNSSIDLLLKRLLDNPQISLL